MQRNRREGARIDAKIVSFHARAPRERIISRVIPITAIAVLVSVLSTNVVMAAPSQPKKLSLLQQGLRYYRGKTITLMLGTAAGSAQDVQNRLLLPQLDSFLHATVNIVDNSTGSGIAADDAVAAAPPNGLTIGLLKLATPLGAIANNSPSLNFNPEHVSFLGGYPSPASPNAMATLTSSPYHTVANMIAATVSNPVPICVTAGTLGDTYLFVRAFGIHARFVTGYTGSVAAVSGLARGDCDAYSATINSFASEVKGGVFGVAWVNEYFKGLSRGDSQEALIANAPTITELAKQYPPKTKLQKEALSVMSALDLADGNVFYAPTKTPAAEVTALQKAIDVGLKSAAVANMDSANGDIVGSISAAQAKQNYIKGVTLVQKYAQLITTA